MKKLISIDGIFVAFASAIGYGFGYFLPEMFGLGVIPSLIICLTLGSLPGMIAGKAVFSKYVQEKTSRRVIAFAVIVGIFLAMYLIGKKCFDYDLISELTAELGYEVVYPLLGFALSIAVRMLKIKKIKSKYGEGKDGFYLSEEEEKYMASLNGENKEISGAYDEKFAVKTENGIFVCDKTRKVRSYLGIPFAKPPIGELRWKAPQEPEKSDKIFEAKYFGPSAIQASEEHISLHAHAQSEDCLYLNVWGVQPSEKDKEKKKVVVYFHGGDYTYGGSADPMWNGENFVEKHPEFLFVSFNYRLGLFGFIDFSAISGGEEYPDTLNLGLLDQIAALKWVKRNISAFGGDPDNIIVMGDSSGAASIEFLSVSKEAEGLFTKAVVLGASLENSYRSSGRSEKLALKLAEAFSAKSMKDLVAVPAEELKKFSAENYLLLSQPVLDGKLLPEDPYKAYAEGKSGKIEFMIGLSKDEMNTYEAIIGEEATSAMVKEYLAALYAYKGSEVKAAIETLISEKEETLGRAGAEKWFVNHWYDLIASLSMAENMKSAGNSPYCFIWNAETIVEKLGSGTAQMVPTILGNNKTAESLGSVVNSNIQLILTALLVKFISGENPELTNNEIKGVSAVTWKPYPEVLTVSDKLIASSEEFFPEEMESIRKLLSIAQM
ncbi:MAG: carboxylesterase family protein [Eubacteriales bacterium]|nr:carboxylesterase family protein [Eubacteriales bacterium]